MESPEQAAALEQVRAARAVADDVLADPSVTGDARACAQQAWDELDTLEGDLVIEDLAPKIEEIQASAADLRALATQMESSAAALQSLATVLGDVVTAVSTVVGIAGVAIQQGLV
jgi:hypothetical protein